MLELLLRLPREELELLLFLKKCKMLRPYAKILVGLHVFAGKDIVPYVARELGGGNYSALLKELERDGLAVRRGNKWEPTGKGREVAEHLLAALRALIEKK